MSSENTNVKERDNNDDLFRKNDQDVENVNKVLDLFSRNLNTLAEEKHIQKVVGRKKEINSLIEIITKKKKRNAILCGGAGTGKTQIVEGLALMIVEKKVPFAISNKVIYELDLGLLVAGTKYRGELEERVASILNELKRDKNIILFIDEVHTVIGAGNAEGGMDVSNMFKPLLAKGEIQVIGATTWDEYKKYVEKDKALTRRFETVKINPPSVEESIEILTQIKSDFEEYHSVEYSQEAIESCVKLSDRYITDRNLPDKAIDLMDKVGAKIHLSKTIDNPTNLVELKSQIEKLTKEKIIAVKTSEYEKAAELKFSIEKLTKEYNKENDNWIKSTNSNKILIYKDSVETLVSDITGIPIDNLSLEDTKKLIDMSSTLKTRVIGQDVAIDKVTKAILRARVKVNDPTKPLSTFLFLGSTGTGKSELTKALNDYINSDKECLIRIDMSEYRDRSSLSRLIGAPAGYVGYEEGGQLTEKVKRKPYSIVLLDEIEKAHPDIWNVFLQVFDDGHLTDGLGNKIDFKNTIIIMTSNIGASKVKDFGSNLGFAINKDILREERVKEIINKEMKNTFSPEFINRIDDVIIFNQLSKDSIYKIIDININKLINRIKDIKYNIIVSDKAKEFLLEKGYDIEMGARPLNRAIQRYIEDPIAELIIGGNTKENDTIFFDHTDGNEELTYKIN